MAEELASTTLFSHHLTVETPIDIDDMIYVLSPEDLPLLSGINGDGFPVLPRTPTGDVIFYWQEEEVPLPRGTLDEELDTSETDITCATGDAVKFSVGDQIRIDDELMIVTAVNTSTEVLTVTRGSATESGTTAATHATGAEIIGVGSVLIEGAIGSSNFMGRDKYSNYCQIWSKTIQMSRTEQLIRKYGVPSELARQTAAMLQNFSLGQEQAALYGHKFRHATNYRRQTGGLLDFVTTNVNSTDDWMTVTSIEEMQQLAYDNGGSFDMIFSNPVNFGALNNIAGNERIQSVTVDDPRRGRRRAQSVMTEFGEVQLVRNRWCRSTDAFAVKRGAFTMRQFRATQMEKLSKTDDTDKFLVVAEGGFQVKGEAHMGRWSSLDSTAALPSDVV